MAKKKSPGLKLFEQFKLLSAREQDEFVHAACADNDSKNPVRELWDLILRMQKSRKALLADLKELSLPASFLAAFSLEALSVLERFPRNRGKPDVKAKCRELRQKLNAKGKQMSYGDIGGHSEILAITDGKGLSYGAVAKHCEDMD